jgi:hypothetical protein
MGIFQRFTKALMPSYAGFVNIPPLEAVILGCLVTYSDFSDYPEQMGAAGFVIL